MVEAADADSTPRPSRSPPWSASRAPASAASSTTRAAKAANHFRPSGVRTGLASLAMRRHCAGPPESQSSARELLQTGGQLVGAADDRATFTDNGLRHVIPAGLRPEQEECVPGDAPTVGHLLRDPCPKQLAFIPVVADARVSQDPGVEEAAVVAGQHVEPHHVDLEWQGRILGQDV